MFFSSFLHPLQLRRARHRRHAVHRPRVEPLEDRCLLSFSPAVSFPAGPTPPYTVVTGDFNTDGHLDVATAADTVNMLAGNGDGTLQPPIQIANLPVTSPSPGADFTSDGIPDRIYRDIEYNLVVRPGRGDGTFGDPIYTPTTGADMLALTTADLNGDGRLDLVLAYWTEFMGGAGSSLLGRGDGTFGGQETFPLGVDLRVGSTAIMIGDFDSDGRPDIAAAGADGLGEGAVTILLNDGNWPAMSPTLPGDYNGNGTVDAADYIVWRKMLGTSVTNFTAADGNGNGIVDQGDQAVWRAHFGETLPAVGAGSLVAANTAITPELSASVESVEVTERASTSDVPLEPDKRGSIEPLGTNARDSALAVLHSWLPQFVPQGKATMRQLHAQSTTDSGIKARVDDLLLVRSAAAKSDQQPSERGLNSRSINDSTEEAVEKRREALDIAFTTLKHAKWQTGGNMLRRVWASLWFAFVLFLGAHAKAAPVVIDSNFGPGDSVKNSVHDVLNQQSYIEHAARFFVPTGTDYTFTGIEVPISDTLAANEGIESQLSIRLWTNDAGQPGTFLESMTTDVNNFFGGYLIQHVDSTSNTTLIQNNYYWISLAAIYPGRVSWFVNNTETRGYAFKSPNGAPWLVIDTANAGAFRVFGEAAPVPEPRTLYLGTMAVIGMRWRRRRRRVSPVRIRMSGVPKLASA